MCFFVCVFFSSFSFFLSSSVFAPVKISRSGRPGTRGRVQEGQRGNSRPSSEHTLVEEGAGNWIPSSPLTLEWNSPIVSKKEKKTGREVIKFGSLSGRHQSSFPNYSKCLVKRVESSFLGEAVNVFWAKFVPPPWCFWFPARNIHE